MASQPPRPKKLWMKTPCIYSPGLSKAAGCNIYLKLENLQPSGSFKSRGIGNMMAHALQEKEGPILTTTTTTTEDADAGADSRDRPVTHFYCSSGGNAGLACARAASALGRPCTIVVPDRTPDAMMARLRAAGATAVVRTGAHWQAADAHLRASPDLLAGDRGGVYVPPFDHPRVWEGASTIVDELVEGSGRGGGGEGDGDDGGDGDGDDGGYDVVFSSPSRPASAEKRPRLHAIVCSVGGGGLLSGIMDGVERAWGTPSSSSSSPSSSSSRPTVLAVETRGAESLHASSLAGELVTLPGITSVATSLGATRVCAAALEHLLRARRREPSLPALRSAVVSDAQAVRGCLRLADEARVLAEVACGAAVAPAYDGILRAEVGWTRDDNGGGGGEGAGRGGDGDDRVVVRRMDDGEWAACNVVLVVCGGSHVSLDVLRDYKEQFGVE